MNRLPPGYDTLVKKLLILDYLHINMVLMYTVLTVHKTVDLQHQRRVVGLLINRTLTVMTDIRILHTNAPIAAKLN